MDTLEALRHFVTIAETGSLSGAARHLAVANSTVTLALQQLERQVGARLVQRSTRKLVFTHEGDRLLADARRLLDDWSQALDGIAQAGALRGPIRVTATRDFGRNVLVPLLDRFMALHPAVHITVLLDDGVVDLIDHNLDLALRNGPLADSSLRSRVLIRSQRIICAAPAYWDRHGRPSHPEQLAAHNCLVLHRPGVPFSTWPFLLEGRTLAVRVAGDRIANDGGVLRHWALQGLGVMIKNRWEVAAEIEQGRLETVLDEFALPHVDLHAVMAAAPNRRVASLVTFLVEALGEA